MTSWHIPNPSDGHSWATFDWSVYAHEVGHDLLGFAGNVESRAGRNTVMSRRDGDGPAYVVSELDIELLVNSLKVNHGRWGTCGCEW